MNMLIYLVLMTLPKSLLVVLALLTLCLLAGCSVQKRTTAPGWHVEKATNLFHQAGASSSLMPDTKSESPALTRMNRIPPRALDWTPKQAPMDTSRVNARVKRQVKRALRREIQFREQVLMFPRGLARGLNEWHADNWHERAEKRSEAQGQPLSELAPDELAKLEHLQNPSRETMQKLKTRKTLTVVATAVFLIATILLVLYIALLGMAFSGG